MRHYAFVLLILLFAGLTEVSANSFVPAVDTTLPLEIVSQQLEILQQENKSVFSGQVVATQGDMQLTADQLSVYFVDGNTIDRFEAVGQVVFRQAGRSAHADKAVFQQQGEILTLTGNAQVQQGQNLVSGDEIVFYVSENRSVVRSSSRQRVKAVIVQEELKGAE